MFNKELDVAQVCCGDVYKILQTDLVDSWLDLSENLLSKRLSGRFVNTWESVLFKAFLAGGGGVICSDTWQLAATECIFL